MATKSTTPISRTPKRSSRRSDHDIGARMIAFALGLVFTLAACGTQESLDAPDTLAMLDDSTTIVADPDAPVIDEPADDSPAAAEPESTDAPATEPMTAPEDPEAPATDAPATDAPAPAAPATDPPSDPPATDAPATPPAGDELVQAEAESFRLLNQLRASLGLTAVARSGEMDSFARNWSQTMATTGNFEHSNGPYGENIAWNSQGALTPVEAAATMHEMWVNSPGHYANMTSADYALTGVGFYLDATGWHATHVFDR